MNTFPLVTIIVPVYNVENYLEDCIISIVNQTYKNIELILVNDGSTDSSEAICKKYADNYPNITLISKKNGGVSSARNTGIKASRGDFLLFCDSDDLISEKLVEILVKEHDGNKNTITFSELTRFSYTPPQNSNHKYTVTFRKFKKAARYGACAMLVPSKTVLENSIFFDESISNLEDSLWYRLLLLHIDNIISIPLNLYYYRETPGSLITRNRDKMSQVKAWYITKIIFFTKVNKLLLSDAQKKKARSTYLYFENNLFSEIYHNKVSFEEYNGLFSDNRITFNSNQYIPFANKALGLFGGRFYFYAYKSIFLIRNLLKKIS